MSNTTHSSEKAAPVVLPVDLRDYFAAKALPVASTFYDTSDEVIEEAAAWSYRMADAMLKARSA